MKDRESNESKQSKSTTNKRIIQGLLALAVAAVNTVGAIALLPGSGSAGSATPPGISAPGPGVPGTTPDPRGSVPIFVGAPGIDPVVPGSPFDPSDDPGWLFDSIDYSDAARSDSPSTYPGPAGDFSAHDSVESQVGNRVSYSTTGE